MFSNPVAFFVSLGLFGLLLIIAEGLKDWLHASTTRRLVHVCVGLYSAVVPFIFQGPGWVYFLAVIFILINAWTRHVGRLGSIHGRDNRSLGTVAFPMAMVVATALCWSRQPEYLWVFSSAFIVLALADPAAGFVGRKYASHYRKIGKAQKSLLGSLVFFLVTAFILAAFLSFREENTTFLWAAGFGALLAMLTEALGGRGWDNLFIVMTIVVWGIVLEEQQLLVVEVMLASLLATGFVILSYRFRLLDLGGAIATCLMGLSLYLLGGWHWLGVVMLFFLIGSFLSKWLAPSAEKQNPIEEKGHVRDAGQVYANGGVAWFCVVAYALFPSELWYGAFLGSIGAAAADTFATEIGRLSKRNPRLITTGKTVAPGTSGGVTVPGMLASLAGAFLIACAGTLLLWREEAWLSIAVITLAGLAGSLVDSILGASVQAGFMTDDGRFTERRYGNKNENQWVKGWHWLGNDRVNMVCTLTGGLLGGFLWAYL